MRAIETAAMAVERAAGQAELASAHIELIAITDVEVRLDGDAVAIEAGGTWSASVSSPTEIEVPGLLHARVVPGTPASDTQAKLEAAQKVLAGGVGAGARRRCRCGAAAGRTPSRVDCVDARGCTPRPRRWLAMTPSTSCERAWPNCVTREPGERPVGCRLRDRGPCRTRCARWPPQAGHGGLRDPPQGGRGRGEAAGGEATRANVAARETDGGAGRTDRRSRERLTVQRSTASDDELAVKAEADGEEARRATALVAELGAELARSAPDAVTAALNDAVRRADSVDGRHDEAAEALREVTTQLKVYGTEGRKGRLDAAQTEREHAEAEYLRMHRRARAAQLLRSVMVRHRDATRLRYVDPFRNQVERLGRIVFGDSFEVEIDSALADLQPDTGGPHRAVRVAVRWREGADGHRRAVGGRSLGGQGG